MKILSKKIAIVGATGAVGRVFLDLLNDNFPGEKDLFLLASKKSEGKKISCGNQEFIVEDLATFDFSRADIAFFFCRSKYFWRICSESKRTRMYSYRQLI